MNRTAANNFQRSGATLAAGLTGDFRAFGSKNRILEQAAQQFSLPRRLAPQ